MPQYWHLVQNNGHIGTYSYILDHISGILIHIWPYFWLICSYWAVSVNIWNGNTRHAQQACMHTSTSMYAYMPVHANISQMHIHLVGLVQSSRVHEYWCWNEEQSSGLYLSIFIDIFCPYFVTKYAQLNLQHTILEHTYVWTYMNIQQHTYEHTYVPYWNIHIYLIHIDAYWSIYAHIWACIWIGQ